MKYLIFVIPFVIIFVFSTQLIAQKDNKEQYIGNKEHAKFLAESVIHKIQAVRYQKLSLFNTENALGNHSLGESPQPDCQSKKKSCNVEQKIARELWEWERALDGFSSQPKPYYFGCIQTFNDRVTVTVTWSESALKTPSCYDLTHLKHNNVVFNAEIPKSDLSYLK